MMPTHTSERSPRPKRRPGPALALALFALALLWTLLLPLGRQLGAAGIGGLELAFWRGLLAGGAFFLQASFSRRLGPLRRQDWSQLLILSILGLSSVLAAFVMADLPAQDLRFWLYLAPALLTVAFWLVTPPSPRKLYVTLLVGLVAAMLILLRAGQPSGLLWGLVLGIGLVAHLHFSRRLLERHAPLTLYALGLPLGAIGLLPLVAFADKSPLVWLGLAAFALGSSYLLYTLISTVLRLLGAPRGLSLACGEPLAALLTLAPLLMSGLQPLGLAVAALTLALVFLLPASHSEPQPARERAQLKSCGRLARRLHSPT